MTPNSFMMTSSTAHIVTESESEPKFCVCLQVQKNLFALCLKMTVDSWSLNYYAPSIFRPLILPGEVRKRPM